MKTRCSPSPLRLSVPQHAPNVIARSTPRSKARVTPGLFFEHLNWGILSFLPRQIPNLADLKSHTRLEGLGQTDWNRKHAPNGKVFHAIVDYAFGSGDRGLTFVGRDDNGQARELRLSYFRNETRLFWDVTSGHPLHPSDLTEYLGQTLTADEFRRCFLCHVTNQRATALASGPEAADRGIGCENCTDRAVTTCRQSPPSFPTCRLLAPPWRRVGRRQTMCPVPQPTRQDCFVRRPRFRPLSGNNADLEPVLYQKRRRARLRDLPRPTSKCHYITRPLRVEVLSCHSGDDHRNVTFENRKRKPLAETAVPTKCPVNPTAGCIGCHMPAVKNVVPHSIFTDHFIRVHRE